MAEKHLHIVSFDVPFPADYGGVIDVFYKIKALHEAGIKVHLHCFEYGRAQAPELKKYCTEVHYYKRSRGMHYLLSSIPFIAGTRTSEKLMERLCADKHPILFEGLHCCYHLQDNRLKNRIKIVRTHNIEHDYYARLASTEKSFFRRMYLKREAVKLESFEQVLEEATHIAAISAADAKDLSARYQNVITVPAFHPNTGIVSREGKGKYALYHGNLKVGENNEAALFLVNDVFKDLNIPLVIAGNNASAELREAVRRNHHIELKQGLPTSDIHTLIKAAQINILPTFQSTGIKLKLLAALYEGRHCLVNTPMAQGTGLEGLCIVKDSPAEMKAELQKLFDIPFTKEEISKRESVLYKDFSNKGNAEKLLTLL